MKGKTYLEVGADGMAMITINNPPLNLLSVDVLLSLKDNTEQALLRDDVNAVVITGKLKVTIELTTQLELIIGKHGKLGFWSIEFVTDILEAARKPFVAAIDGPTLGGGLEIALACHARISTSSAVLGLPELSYGILPGLGGTQRLPRLVGLRKALEMILMSKLVNGDNARGIGLVDGISSDLLTTTARHWAKDILAHRSPWTVSLYRTDWLEPLPEAKMMLEHARALHELRQSDTCRSLVYFFFARQRTSKVPGITDMGLIPRKVNTFAVVGGGILGSSIATALILSNYSVILKELHEKALLAGIERVKGVLHYEGFREVDMVIEVWFLQHRF
ncbi:hypothetical protein PVK06_044356 [Gossypium arboreum]|uniref:3-hydroxyacyl-CoA dehydrogenase NAD binding domain-containing protein n=1 Tax=Gossypium arboreum TaxID=29729 RepID=A0ABR0MQY4_GOSAR|nr:hypothetical protein PVK06_044356 [Gossypium arboreum]